jgi:MFS family permease
LNIAKRLAYICGFYYGWIIVAVALVSMGFWFGIRSGFAIFYVALLEDFSWNRGESAAVQSMAMIAYTIMAPVVGGLIDRFGPRRVVVPGILILFLGLMLCALIETLTQFYIYFGVIVGMGVTSIGIVSYSAILAHWFEKRRGLASGVAVSGIGLGVFALVPLSQSFISIWGWRLAFIVLGGMYLIILLPLNGIFLRHKPEEIGQNIEGMNPEEKGNRPNSGITDHRNSNADWTIGKALRSGRFWVLMAFPFFSVMGIYIVLVHNVKFLVDQGIDKMTAAFIFGIAGIISAVFRIFWGWLSDHIGREATYTIGLLFGCLGVASLLILEVSGIKKLVFAFLIFFGMGWGVTAPIFMSVSADLFKGKIYGLIYGLIEAGIGIAGAIGAWVAGFIFDKTQSYRLAFVLVIIVFLLSSFFIWMAAPRKARVRQEADDLP